MNFKSLCHICPAILIFSGRTGRALCAWILVLTMGLIALPVQGQEDEVEYVRGGIVEIEGLIYFAAQTSIYGRELWATDGTAGGTRLVTDIGPGLEASGSPKDLTKLPSELLAENELLFFSANANDGTGRELFGHNPATGVTAQIADIRPGPFGGSPQNLTVVNGVLFFTATDGNTGVELWKHDPATGTTTRFDVWIGPNASQPADLIELNGALFFTANDGSTGRELWKYDLAADVTSRVADINPGEAGAVPDELTEVNGALFFTANDGYALTGTGNEVWKHDPATGVTARIADINPGSSSSSPLELTEVNDALFFVATDGVVGDELWKHDPGTGVTALIADIVPGPLGSFPSTLTEFNDSLFFTGDDGATGRELWKHDPATGVTALVLDIAPGIAASFPQLMMEANGVLFFVADDGATGRELWQHDPATGMTALIADLVPGPAPPVVVGSGTGGGLILGPTDLSDVNDVLYFNGDGGPTTGRELWKYDPVTGILEQVIDLEPGPSGSSPGS